MANVDSAVLKSRVKGKVRFTCFRDGSLWYACEDGWEFPVAVQDTINAQGASPTFQAEDKGIVFMRWVRRHMEQEVNLRNLATLGEGVAPQ